LNKTQHKQKTPFSDWISQPLILFKPGPIKAPFGSTNICQSIRPNNLYLVFDKSNVDD
jgi:hypothetical protein